MNYKKHYDLLINRARNRLLEGYTERHHIIPRCIGGSDDPNNLVDLTPEEHYVAHQLLVKMYPKEIGLILAVLIMTGDNDKRNQRGNKLYGWLRRKYSESRKGKSFEELYGDKKASKIRNKIKKALKGKTYEEIYGEEKAREKREEQSKTRKGRVSRFKGLTKENDQRAKKVSDALIGKSKSPEHVKNIRKSRARLMTGKTYEEQHGLERARKIKVERSIRMKKWWQERKKKLEK